MAMAQGGSSGSEDQKYNANTELALTERVAALERQIAAITRQLGLQTKAAEAVMPAFVAGQTVTAPVESAPVSAPPPPPPMPAPSVPEFSSTAPALAATAMEASVPEKGRTSFEMQLGSQIFNRIGILLVLIGVAWFLKYAVDQQWIGPVGRIVAGLVAGAGIVLWSESFRRKGYAAFSYSLKAVGSGVLYLTLWAAFHVYHLLPASVALVLMVLVTAWNAFMAWAQDAELLAAYALAGGFITPLLLATGGNQETFLFSYILAIDLAAIALVRVKVWPRLLLGAFPATVLFFAGWYSRSYVADELTRTLFFIGAFAASFASVSVRRTPIERAGPSAHLIRSVTLIEEILLPLANAAFLAGAGYSVLQDSSGHSWLPWMMVILAALYLGLMQMPQGRTAAAMHLSIAVVFLTIAIPLKASGDWITVSWLVEGLALLWVATRLMPTGGVQSIETSESYASTTLRLLASGALALGFFGIFAHSISSGLLDFSGSSHSFFDATTGTALTGIAVFAVATWLALRSSFAAPAVTSWLSIAIAGIAGIDLVALLLTLREVLFESGTHRPLQSADFLTALIGLAVFACVATFCYRFGAAHPETNFWRNCAGSSTIAFNLIAVLTGVREIGTIWSNRDAAVDLDAALQQALAISAYLMLYGAVLLAVGFWKRSAFLRWQALLLLVFSIFKTFLYDMRNLSQGYRVASALGLGILLMAISFAYQKDWLNLREAIPKPSAKAETPR
jgi:uncharacterized membrane protein